MSEVTHATSFAAAQRLRVRFRWLKAAMWISSISLLIFFGWLELSSIPYHVIINDTDPSDTMKPILLLLYLSWIFGIALDVNTQELVYTGDEGAGNPVRDMIMTVVGIVACGILLFYVRSDIQLFSIALTLFSLFCLIALLLVIRTTRRMIITAEVTYRQSKLWIACEQLNIVRTYLSGKWVWVRQAVLGVMLIGLNAVCWSGSLQTKIGQVISDRFPDFSSDAVARFSPTFVVAVFLLVSESWQWYMRIKTRLLVGTLGLLSEKYTVTRSSGY